MKGLSVFFLVLVPFLLQGCATSDLLASNACRGTNWHERGMADAKQGKPLTEISRIQKSCNSQSVDSAAYLSGWQAGMHDYCLPTYQEGFDAATQRKGKAHFNKRKKACAAYNVKFIPDHYQLGFRMGQREMKMKHKGKT